MPSAAIAAIVIGGSAGALEALFEMMPGLPTAFRLPIALVVHLPPDRPSLLARVLASKCALAVRDAEDKHPLTPGTVHVAVPNYHLLIERSGVFSLSVDDPVHYSRPAIDVLFESAADAYGPALAGVLLSGANADGARGLARIEACGGITAVQSPASALARTMPDAALRLAKPHHVLAPAELGAFLVGLDQP
jgi:two-component system, chemotaxis family, protein-glutamate methylesterase/glutaminase